MGRSRILSPYYLLAKWGYRKCISTYRAVYSLSRYHNVGGIRILLYQVLICQRLTEDGHSGLQLHRSSAHTKACIDFIISSVESGHAESPAFLSHPWILRVWNKGVKLNLADRITWLIDVYIYSIWSALNWHPHTFPILQGGRCVELSGFPVVL